MKKYLFVYGTLMSGFRNHKQCLEGKYEKKYNVYTKGRLYHLIIEDAPVLLKGEDKVQGELYEIENPEENLKEVDKMEEDFKNNIDEGEYVREEIDVYIEGDKKIKADSYVYNIENMDRFLGNAIYLPEGDWRKFKSEKGTKAYDIP